MSALTIIGGLVLILAGISCILAAIDRVIEFDRIDTEY